MERSNEPTVYNFEGGVRLRQQAIRLGAITTYSTKKIEFFRFANGRKFLLEPDRDGQVNIGFVPGLAGRAIAELETTVGKHSNVKSHWGLPNIEFQKIVVAEVRSAGAITLADATALLTRLSQ